MKKIICIGGGPTGLYFSILMKLNSPELEITVFERNRSLDTFGWGVVFSDQTLDNLLKADPVTAQKISNAFNHWDDIEVFLNNQKMSSSGHGFCGIGRKHLLNILQERCNELGVKLVFETEVNDIRELIIQSKADLVIASDGLNSKIREKYTHTFQADIDIRKCRFVWFGTHKLFDAFTFAFEKTEHGWFQAHAYRYDDNTSTFIVETHESVWNAHGFAHKTKEESVKFCEKLFAKYLNGNSLMTNAAHLRGSAIWMNFPRIMCKNWIHWEPINDIKIPIVLMGDAAHTAHFSIGSGTKLGFEDAIDLSSALIKSSQLSLLDTLNLYQKRRSVEVFKIQNAARNSTNWFENVARYTTLPFQQFYYSLITRSQRISHENLRLRDPEWLTTYEQWLSTHHNTPDKTQFSKSLPMLIPLKVRGIELKNRIVVSPMAMYSSSDGIVGPFHMVHLGARAIGGAGLVMVEMTSPTPEGRITLGCPGLWNNEQMNAFSKIVNFVHTQNTHIGIQLGHSGPKGSTQLGWEEIDKPIKGSKNWPLIAASAIPYSAENQTPASMTHDQMQSLIISFMVAAHKADRAGFDWLELHCAHGYLLSSFICPLTNIREDQYGGSVENRCRFPLEIFRAIREVWPGTKPMSVRISAHDWAEGGNTDDDAIKIAALFKEAGCDVIDVSSGQTTTKANPVYGRMYQTPFSDRIRNEVSIHTIAVGAITEGDQVKSIIAAGRADLCAIARPHLANPAWTLHECAKLGVLNTDWPNQYLSGRDQMYRLINASSSK